MSVEMSSEMDDSCKQQEGDIIYLSCYLGFGGRDIYCSLLIDNFCSVCFHLFTIQKVAGFLK